MRALVQRVTEALVVVDGEVVGAIGPGLCALVGVTHDDDAAVACKLADKVLDLRVLADEERSMNRSVADSLGTPSPAGVLVVSQFTLYGDASRGRRPSWTAAARPEHAQPLIDAFVERMRERGAPVATGRFGADMQLSLVNDGPVTVLLEA